MLFSTKMRRFKLVSGIILLLGGVFFSVFPCLVLYKDYIDSTLGFGSIVCFLILLAFSITVFYSSTKCFIAYGMSKGVDYCLEVSKEKYERLRKLRAMNKTLD